MWVVVVDYCERDGVHRDGKLDECMTNAPAIAIRRTQISHPEKSIVGNHGRYERMAGSSIISAVISSRDFAPYTQSGL